MFTIYINDIVKVHDSVFCNMYADDTVIVTKDVDIHVAIEKSKEAFQKTTDWCALNKIKVNKMKTKHMIIGGREQVRERDKTFYIQGINTVENFIYLGINIDNKLNFEKFINNTISRVNGRLITLSRERKLLDTKISLLIYKQTILPILDYLCILVNSSTQRRISKLQPLQNKAIRIIETCTGYISTMDIDKLHVKLNLKLLRVRRNIFMLKMMYKLSRIEENVNRYRPEMMLRTGPKVKMKIVFTDKERVRRSPYYIGINLWDKLESDLQLSKTQIEFNNKLKHVDVQSL